MSAFKKLPRQDVFVSDYESRKQWMLSGSSLNTVGVQYLAAWRSKPGYPYPNDREVTDGGYEYYSSKTYSTIHTQFYADAIGNGIFSGSRDLSLQSSLTWSGSRDIGEQAMIVAVPQNIFGTQLEPNTFVLQPNPEGGDDYIDVDYVRDKWCGGNNYVENASTAYGTNPPPDDPDYFLSESFFTEESRNGSFFSGSFVSESVDLQYVGPDLFTRQEIVDDGNGNLIFSGSERVDTTDRRQLGDIIYNQGIAVVTDPEIATHYTSFASGELSFRSNLPIYTYNVYCRLRDSEFNFTYNPSAVKATDGIVKDNVSGSDFSPYITTVGLYNDANELLAVGKLNKPVKKLQNSDMNILIQLDI